MSHSFHQISENDFVETSEDIIESLDSSENLIQQVGLSDLISKYNLIELGLEDYEPNELVLNTIHHFLIINAIVPVVIQKFALKKLDLRIFLKDI